MALTNAPKKVERARGKLGLASDERIDAGCSTMPRGGVRQFVARTGVRGVAGSLLAHAASRGTVATQGLADRYLPGQNYLIATDRRLFMVSVNPMGRPQEIVSEWAPHEVHSIEVGSGMLSHPMTVRFSDGSVLELDGERASDPRSMIHP